MVKYGVRSSPIRVSCLSILESRLPKDVAPRCTAHVPSGAIGDRAQHFAELRSPVTSDHDLFATRVIPAGHSGNCPEDPHPAISNDVALSHPGPSLRQSNTLAIVSSRMFTRQSEKGNTAEGIRLNDGSGLYSNGRPKHNRATGWLGTISIEDLAHGERGVAIGPGVPDGQGSCGTRATC